jgi:hypothetical protein
MKWLRWMAMMVMAAWPPVGAESGGPAEENPRSVQMRGRVVCLAEEMHRALGALLPTRHEHLWGFKAEDGSCYTLLRSRYSEAIFLDERLRAKDLAIKARLFPRSHVIEVSVIRSLRDRKVMDLYYYCDVCAIKAVSPEPCACCQGPMELREEPLSDRDD